MWENLMRLALTLHEFGTFLTAVMKVFQLGTKARISALVLEKVNLVMEEYIKRFQKEPR